MKHVGVVVSAALASLLMACSEVGPASLEFVDITPAQPRIGDIVTVKFRAMDSRGLPAAGIPVSFALQSPTSGVTLSPVESQTNKGSGEVLTQVIAANRMSSLVVVATSGDKVAQSKPFNIAGSEGSGRGITFQCGETNGAASGGIHALMAYGPGRDLIAGVKVNCTAHVADRNGDGIPNAQVSFLAEAGTIGPTSETVTDVVGNAQVLYKTSYPLPVDVEPGLYVHNPVNDLTHIGQRLAPEWMLPWEWRSNPMAMPAPDPSCANGCEEPRRRDPVRPGKVNNPRDNLVTLIAVTSGEEHFVDTNNNGRWDEGEPFEDTVEPFVDANDNGTWDPDELYIDTNADGVWTPKNGRFDPVTLIWAQERILWTGLPNDYDYQINPPPNPPPGYVPTIGTAEPLGTTNIAHGGYVRATARYSDPWFNTFAQNGDSDGCSANATDNVKAFPGLFGDTGQRLRYPAIQEVGFIVQDAHPTTEADGGTPVPSDYMVEVFCRVTGAPVGGAVYEIPLGGVAGRVQ